MVTLAWGLLLHKPNLIWEQKSTDTLILIWYIITQRGWICMQGYFGLSAFSSLLCSNAYQFLCIHPIALPSSSIQITFTWLLQWWQKHQICCSLYLCIHWFILICTPTRNWTHNLSVLRQSTNWATKATLFLFLSSPWLSQTWNIHLSSWTYSQLSNTFPQT